MKYDLNDEEQMCEFAPLVGAGIHDFYEIPLGFDPEIVQMTAWILVTLRDVMKDGVVDTEDPRLNPMIEHMIVAMWPKCKDKWMARNAS